jgi:hypothetical protein
MGLDEITPHLNKIATLYLTNRKRKVGWIFIETLPIGGTTLQEIYFVSVQKGKQFIAALERRELQILEPYREAIPLSMIERIRSSK